MKHTFLLSAIMIWVGFAFAQPSDFKIAPTAKQGEVIIRGKIGNGSSPHTHLEIYMGTESWDTVSVSNGTFEYRKKTLLPAYGAIMVRYLDKASISRMRLANVIFDAGIMEVNMATDSISTSSLQITGSGAGLFNLYQAYWFKEGEIYYRLRDLSRAFNSQATPEQLQDDNYLKEHESKEKILMTQLDSLILAEVKNYPGSFHTRFAYQAYLKVRNPKADLEIRSNIISYFAEPDRSMNQKVLEEEKNPKPEPTPLVVGDSAIALQMHDPKGNKMQLSDFKGKYLLLDFWASWCVPCRKSNPLLKQIYDKYKGRGLEILGISVDEIETDWRKAILDDGLTWPQAVIESSSVEDVHKKYGVYAVPSTFLIDPSGRIISINLHAGKDLEPRLEELLK